MSGMALAGMLQQNRSLREADVAANELGAEVASVIKEAALQNSAIRRLARPRALCPPSARPLSTLCPPSARPPSALRPPYVRPMPALPARPRPSCSVRPPGHAQLRARLLHRPCSPALAPP